jgi:hypothetical protein
MAESSSTPIQIFEDATEPIRGAGNFSNTPPQTPGIENTAPRNHHLEVIKARCQADGARPRNGKLFKEREWPETGDLQLQDGIDIACVHCAFDSSKEFAFIRTEYADRKFDSTDALHTHVLQWHIERRNGSHRGVMLWPTILCRDGTIRPALNAGEARAPLQEIKKPHRFPESRDVVGPPVNSTQLRAAEKFKWDPAMPGNRPPYGYRGNTTQDPRTLPNYYTDRKVYFERAELYERNPLVQDGKGEWVAASKFWPPVPYNRTLNDNHDIRKPGLFAWVDFQADGSVPRTIPYGKYLSLKAKGTPCALNGIVDQAGRTVDYTDICKTHISKRMYRYTIGMTKRGWSRRTRSGSSMESISGSRRKGG